MKAYKSPPIHRTPLYRAKAAYVGMQKRCLNRDGKNPTYATVELQMTLEEWLSWAVPVYARFMHRFPGHVPHAARIGDKGHYVLGNVQIVPEFRNWRRLYPVEAGKKRCSECKEPLDVAMFNKNRSRRDGLAGQCRECCKKHGVVA